MKEIDLFDKFKSLYWETYYSHWKINEYHNIKEFIQLKILEFIATSKFNDKFILVWWSAIRLFYWSNRLSNDLDFNTTNITPQLFYELCENIKDYLISCWHLVELRFKNNEYYHCYLSIYTPIIKERHSEFREVDVNIKIKFDAVDDNWDYPIDYFVPNKTINNIPILTTFCGVLLSKKIIAFLSRGHDNSIAKDLYDILFLLENFDPDFHMLNEYEYIMSYTQLFDRLEKRINEKGFSIELAIEELNEILTKNKIDNIESFREKLKIFKNNLQ